MRPPPLTPSCGLFPIVKGDFVFTFRGLRDVGAPLPSLVRFSCSMVSEIRQLKDEDLAFDPLESLGRAWRTFTDLTLQSFRQSEYNLMAVAVCGVIGMPLYYFVWHNLFPQPYENFWLRLIGFLLCGLMALRSFWPRRLQPFMPVLWYIVLLYALPFFFGYMLLMNDISPVWLVTWVCGLFMLVVVVDWINLIIMVALGSAAAWIAFILTSDHMIDPNRLLEQLPVILFALVAGTIFSYRRGSLRHERLEAVRAIGRNVSREISGPLRGVTTSTIGLKQYLPILLRSYDQAVEDGTESTVIPAEHRRALSHIVERIQGDIGKANTLVHLLSVNTSGALPEQSTYRICSMAECLSLALDRYPFTSEAERYAVQLRTESDFVFWGSEDAMIDVLVNLIKASFVLRGPAGKGDVTIRLEPGARRNRVAVHAASTGVAVRSASAVFDVFSPLEYQSGTGPGLAHAKNSIEAMKGVLTFHPKPGGFVEFTLDLPATGTVS